MSIIGKVRKKGRKKKKPKIDVARKTVILGWAVHK